jgi:hypothetical protein
VPRWDSSRTGKAHVVRQTTTPGDLPYDQSNPFEYVEIRGTATVAGGADEHIDALSAKYIGQDSYPFRQPGEERVKFVVQPDKVRHQKQG